MIHIDYESLTGTFVAETEEGLALIEEALVALERKPGDAFLIQTVFRVAHTLKGNADSLGFSVVMQFAHTLEDVLQDVRDGTARMTPQLTTLLLQSVDALRQMVADAVDGIGEWRPEHEALHQALAQTKAGQSGKGRTKRARSTTKKEEAERQTGARAAGEGLPDVVSRGRSTTTVRVDIATLDSILNLTGEIAIWRGRLAQMLDRGQNLSRQDFLEAHRDADSLYLDLQELVMKARMIPLGPTFRNYVRTVRDIATAHGKQAELVIDSGEVEVDMRMVDHLRDPLTHMIRNALDHGIEPPKERTKLGKPAMGRITVRAYYEAGSVVIQISDDGRGLDRNAILEKARSRGTGGDLDALSDHEIHQLIFEAGFSTVAQVTELSGRGVGMDVVRRNIEALSGSVTIASTAGKGSTFTIRLPLTLAIMEGFGVEAGGEVYIIQLENVVECLELPDDVNGNSDHGLMINLRGTPLACLRLRNLFRLNGGLPERESVVVVQHNDQLTGIVVDSLCGQSQAVIKPLGKLFHNLPGIAGSTIMGDGQVALILDVTAVINDYESSRAAAAGASGNGSGDPQGMAAAGGPETSSRTRADDLKRPREKQPAAPVAARKRKRKKQTRRRS